MKETNNNKFLKGWGINYPPKKKKGILKGWGIHIVK
jgi:hypothetical protein